jgi:membrane-associated phospholipid phosphatase
LCGALVLGPCGARAESGLETAGDILQIALPAASAGATWANGDGEGFVQFARSAAVTLGVTHLLKYAVDAERPNGGGHSFPSGHTSISFASAEFLRKRYGWGWGLPAYALAGVVGHSRVDSREHHTRDVVAGALIGVVSSWIFTEPREGLVVELTVDQGGGALMVACVW